MELYTVGKPYPGGLLPPSNNYNYRQGQHELIVSMPDLADSEISDFRSGEARFALTVLDSVIFLSYKFGDQPWSDAPFNWHLVPTEMRSEPPVTTGDTRAILFIILIDAKNGIVQALREITFSPRFTRLLHANIVEQIKSPVSREQHYADVDDAYQRYTSDELVNLAIDKCKGGD